MRILQVTQGTDQWHAERARRRTASECPAVMGASKYTSRSQLLHQKATGIVPEVDAAKQRLFDKGHQVEGPARAIVEEDLGEDLSPVTVVSDDDRLLASLDGATMMMDVIFEHKLWSEDLAAQVRAGELEPHYFWQLEHQLLVSAAKRAIFVCSDGTRERFVSMEYRPVPGRAEQLLAAWDQFDADLAAYIPPAAAEPAPTGRAPESLPALRIELMGQVTASNLAEFKATALGAIRSVNRELTTDQHFADAKQAVKWCAEVETRIKAAKEHALSQTATIEELFRTLDDVSAEARSVRLDLEKLVTRREHEIKGELVAGAKAAYEQHEAACRQDAGAWKLLAPPDFGSAIKGKRSVDSMRDALNACLANAKIAASEQARKIRANLSALDEESKGSEHLFRDRLTFIDLTPDAVRLMVRQRIAEHRAAEERRAAELAERERERIRREEAERLEREAAQRALKEAAAAEAARIAAAPAPTQPPAAAQIAPPAASSQAGNVLPMQRPTPAPATPPTLTLGQIGKRLGFNLTADFLKSLGFEPAGRERSAVLFHEASWPAMCQALINHIATAAEQRAAA